MQETFTPKLSDMPGTQKGAVAWCDLLPLLGGAWS